MIAFNASLLTTFGKLDQKDIHEIDGQYDRLADCLMSRYQWDAETAQSKIAQFRSNLVDSVETPTHTSGMNHD